MTFQFRTAPPEQASRPSGLRLGSFEHDGMSVEVTQHGDGTVEFDLSAPGHNSEKFKRPIPFTPEVHVVIGWQVGQTVLYLNGKESARKSDWN
jgi:hypothetical protein